MHTQYVYNTALYVCINSCTYMHPQCKSLHPLWSWFSYGWSPRESRKNDEKNHTLYLCNFWKFGCSAAWSVCSCQKLAVLKKLRQIGVDLIVHFLCEKIALYRQYAGCVIVKRQVTWTRAAEGFPRPSVVVPIMFWRKISTFSERPLHILLQNASSSYSDQLLTGSENKVVDLHSNY